ncbi:HNH endonuclease [Serratia ureilytica]|uniref:HNH endonuclease signature motif containing protein n=1 Tax=Serratia ureilytica TaxID=300181 RepID=UPI0011C82020|nr:HNH endonuclease [Serratia ureilytica]
MKRTPLTSIHQLTQDELARFDMKTIKPRRLTQRACIAWGGAQSEGHGYAWVSGRNVVAARVAYLKANGSLETSETVVHLCGNKLCVRPEHLKALPRSEANALKLEVKRNLKSRRKQVDLKDRINGSMTMGRK